MSDTKYDVQSGFYDSINHDRLYSADDMNQPYKSILTEGVVEGCMHVIGSIPAAAMVVVQSGYALLGGKWVNSAEQEVAIEENSAIYDRVDSIILRVDTTLDVRAASIVYRPGEPAAEPQAPSLVSTGGIFELRLANVTVAAGASTVLPADVTDTRGGSDCPYMTIKVGNTQIVAAVEDVLAAHPEWTTTVADGSITLAKFASGVIDNTLSQAGAAADAKATGDAIANLNNDLGQLSSLTTEDKDSAVDAINELNEKKADINGSYDDMTVGGAKQLLSNVYETESAPYIFRASGGSLEIGDREQDTLVGMDLVWNQVLQNGNFESTSGWNVANCTISVANNVLTATITNTNASIYKGVTYIESHKYLLIASVNPSFSTEMVVGGRRIAVDANKWSTIGGVISATSSTNAFRIYFDVSVSTSSGTVDVQKCMLFDLTAMFGSMIADYIYSLESATAGAGVAWVKRYLTKDYYPHSAPTLQNGVASSHETTGFNQIGENWTSGKFIDSTTGSVTDFSGRCADETFYPILPDTLYYGFCVEDDGAYDIAVAQYDENKNYISSQNVIPVNRVAFRTLSTARYIRVASTNPDIPNYHCCINIHYDGERDGEYEPYVKHSYPLDDTVDLHGLPKIDASGNLYADGDTYEADGTVTRRYGVVDLGTLSWTAYQGTFFANHDGIKQPANSSTIANIRCQKYESSTQYYVLLKVSDNIIGINSEQPRIHIYDSSYSESTAEQFKTAMNGVMLVYELATPTTESAAPFQTPQIVDNWGTEEYVTEGVIPIGHSTKYPVNLRSKIEVEPNSPTSDGVYLMQRENGVNTYVPYISEIPSLPSENGTFSLKVTVSGSTKTVSWVSD